MPGAHRWRRMLRPAPPRPPSPRASPTHPRPPTTRGEGRGEGQLLAPTPIVTRKHPSPRSGHPPEGMVQEEQGVQARARWPLTFIARGAKNALLGRFRRPPDAWIGLSTLPCGVPEARLRRIRAPASAVRRGSPRFHPQPSLEACPECAGAWTVYPPCQPTHRTTAPRLLVEKRT